MNLRALAPSTEVLDNPAWTAMTAHPEFAVIEGGAARFPARIGLFAGLAGPHAWPDLAQLVGPDEQVTVVGAGAVPAGWEVVRALRGVQLVGPTVSAAPDADAVRLTAADVPHMWDLVRRANPGAFADRTIELGTYLGIRRDGALIAMAGQRFRPPGWTEISAVCTDPAHQGQGLAGRLIGAIVADIHARGELPFLHTAEDNTTAIRVYQRLGFRLRRPMSFTVVRPKP